MKLLVLNVDRDDDLGRKTSHRGPCIGREAVLQAATALAVADPEEADANGMFAAVKEYDEILADKPAYGADEVFVAAATGHIREGTQADAVMAHQIDQIIDATHADHVIIVSDGGEDEHVIPMLQTRLKVDGVRRVIIKQARNLEGALFLFGRLLHDEKLQRKFFLPFALLMVALAVAIFYGRPQIFVAAALFLAAFYILIQVFKWQRPLGTFFGRVAKELRAGKLSFAASLVALVIVVWAGFDTLRVIQASNPPPTTTRYTLLFVDTILWRFILAVVVVLVGRAMDERIREHRIRPRYWEAFFIVLAGGFFIDGVVGALQERWTAGIPWIDLPTAQLATQTFFGGFLVLLALITRRYYAPMNGRRAATAQADAAPK